MSTSQSPAASSPAPSTSPAWSVPGSVYAGLIIAAMGRMITGLVGAGVVGEPVTASTAKSLAYLGVVAPVGLLLAAFGLLAQAARRDSDRLLAAASLVGATLLVVAAFRS